MVYSYTYEKTYGKTAVKYAAIGGEGDTVFIKTGRGGHIFGENSLYETIAAHINKTFGYSVMVADNPENETRDNPLTDDMKFIEDSLGKRDIIYIGSSAGANYGAWYGWQFPSIKKMLLVNPILNFNFHRMMECVKNFAGNITFALGDLDISFRWRVLIPKEKNVKITELSGQGHCVDGQVFCRTVTDFLT